MKIRDGVALRGIGGGGCRGGEGGDVEGGHTRCPQRAPTSTSPAPCAAAPQHPPHRTAPPLPRHAAAPPTYTPPPRLCATTAAAGTALPRHGAHTAAALRLSWICSDDQTTRLHSPRPVLLATTQPTLRAPWAVMQARRQHRSSVRRCGAVCADQVRGTPRV